MSERDAPGLAVRCLQCGEVIQGQAVGQVVRCGCGAVGVDPLEDRPQGMTRILGKAGTWETVSPG